MTPSPLEHRHIQAGWGARPGDGHAAQQDFLWGRLMGAVGRLEQKKRPASGCRSPLHPSHSQLDIPLLDKQALESES